MYACNSSCGRCGSSIKSPSSRPEYAPSNEYSTIPATRLSASSFAFGNLVDIRLGSMLQNGSIFGVPYSGDFATALPMIVFADLAARSFNNRS